MHGQQNSKEKYFILSIRFVALVWVESEGAAPETGLAAHPLIIVYYVE
jgi:hypothetical protein